MLTIYVIAHYIIREKEGDPSDNTDKKIRLVSEKISWKIDYSFTISRLDLLAQVFLMSFLFH
jgi:hypothetical protein